MEEIYWIQRIGTMRDICNVTLMLSTLAIIFLAFGSFIEYNEYDCDEPDSTYNRMRRWLRRSFVIAFVSMMGSIFIPSKTDLYAIYGIGGTIDYIKSNDTAKQLPDKVVNDLDKWLDEKTEEDKE